MRVLLIIDRATGETERIREDDPNFGASIIMAADRADLAPLQALRLLEDGQDLRTPGFVRRLVVAS